MTTKPILKQPKTYLLVQSGYTLFTTALVRSVLGKFHPSLMRSGFETKMEGAISNKRGEGEGGGRLSLSFTCSLDWLLTEVCIQSKK